VLMALGSSVCVQYSEIARQIGRKFGNMLRQVRQTRSLSQYWFRTTVTYARSLKITCQFLRIASVTRNNACGYGVSLEPVSPLLLDKEITT